MFLSALTKVTFFERFRCLNLRQYLRVYNSLRAQTAAVREFEEKKAAEKEALAVDGASAACGDNFELNSKILDQVWNHFAQHRDRNNS